MLLTMFANTHIPEWARWIAQDADGTWWAYEHEPNESHSGWYENEVGRSVKLYQDEVNTSWRESCRKQNPEI